MEQSTTKTEHKKRYLVLDGLRGVAAVAVLIFHGRSYMPDRIFSHGYLAVDFFFVLSGFVVSYAYEEHLANRKLSVGRFAIIRAIRLYPLIIVGAVLGAAVLAMRHYLGSENTPGGVIAVAFILSTLALPALGLMSPPYKINGPTWSLTCEIAVNMAYAVFCRFLSSRVLLAIAALSLVAETVAGIHAGTISKFGASEGPLWAIAARTAFPFAVGILIQRHKNHLGLLRPISHPLLLALVLLIVLSPPPMRSYDWAYAMFCVAIIFPVIVGAGALYEPTGQLARVAKWSADASYPLYALHYPVVRAFLTFTGHFHLSHRLMSVAFCGLAASIVIAATLVAPIDERFRRWLSRRLLPKEKQPPQAALRSGAA